MPPKTRLRRIAPLCALAVLAALAPSAGARAHPGSRPRGATASGSRLHVAEVEYRLLLSRGVVKAGAVNLDVIDRGVDPHDLRLRARSSEGEIAAPELTPGRRWDAVVHLKPGTYRLWCTLPEHVKLGMHATLTVVR